MPVERPSPAAGRVQESFRNIGQESDVFAAPPATELIGHCPDHTARPPGIACSDPVDLLLQVRCLILGHARRGYVEEPAARACVWVGSTPRCAMIEGMGDTAGTARGLMLGAVLGGLGWGLLAANTVGGRGDQAHLRAVAGPWLTGAGLVSLLCLYSAKVMWPAADGSWAAMRRTFAMALVTAPMGGWAFLFLQWLQYS